MPTAAELEAQGKRPVAIGSVGCGEIGGHNEVILDLRQLSKLAMKVKKPYDVVTVVMFVPPGKAAEGRAWLEARTGMVQVDET